MGKWKHGPHIGHHHPPKKTWPDYADYGLSQEQIDRINEHVLQWQAEYGDEAFFARKWELEDKTQEEWEEEGSRKRVDLITSDMDAINAFKYLEAATPNPYVTSSGYFGKYLPEFAERAVAENPDFLEGHLFLARKEYDMSSGRVGTIRDTARAIEIYLEIVFHPEVHSALSPTDVVNSFETLGTLLMMDEPFEAIEYFEQANLVDPKSGLYGLSVAYQRLGDLKTGWTYLKKLQTYPHMRRSIAM